VVGGWWVVGSHHELRTPEHMKMGIGNWELGIRHLRKTIMRCSKPLVETFHETSLLHFHAYVYWELGIGHWNSEISPLSPLSPIYKSVGSG
jgi:hypothetical protein